MPSHQVNIIPSHQIDKQKWDKCVTHSFNGSIYARSFYLDIMSSHWDGLVLNDYQAIMPLLWKRKYGFSYLYQPMFIRHTAVCGYVTDEIISSFFSAVPKHFKYWNIDLKENSINPHIITNPHLYLNKRRNFLLPLNKEYREINKEYKRLAHRMLKKAYENNVDIIRNCDPEVVIDFYRTNYKNQQKNITPANYKDLVTATRIAFNQGQAQTYLAKIKEKIIAAYMILKDENFIYSLIGGSNDTGKKYGAFYLLTDAAIKDNCQTERIFRFEGSDKKGIALFNSQFNPMPVDYYNIKFNGLPWPLKLLK